MSEFRKQPVVINAWQWDESLATKKKLAALGMRWCRHNGHVDHPDLCKDLSISTLEGAMRVEPGDWIIKGVAGEFYPCKPDIFAATYEAVSDDGKTAGPPGSAEQPHCDCRNGGDSDEAQSWCTSKNEARRIRALSPPVG